MHRLVIHKLGPIADCELTCKKFMTFTGFQASGKSTIAKAMYYFRTIKKDIYTLAEEKALSMLSLNENENKNDSLSYILTTNLREKFIRVFGSSWAMDNDMYLKYFYTDRCWVKVSLKKDTKYSAPNYIWLEFSDSLIEFLKAHDNVLTPNALGIPDVQKQKFQADLDLFFDDIYNLVYIPAGRSMLTLLYQQLAYIYTTMKDAQKRAIDYCTQDYIERILSLKPEFTNGLNGLAALNYSRNKDIQDIIDQALELISKVLRGAYTIASNGEERIVLKDNRYVKLNFASSGQQESVWILNLLFYYLVQNKPVLFIIEEPESHLFPSSQKYITELISLVANTNHSVILTTHSPYVLGTLNNLLFAHQTPDTALEQAAKVIPQSIWIDSRNFYAWFVKNGGIEGCMDEEMGLIQNQKIDDISAEINQDFDDLLELQLGE